MNTGDPANNPASRLFNLVTKALDSGRGGRATLLLMWSIAFDVDDDLGRLYIALGEANELPGNVRRAVEGLDNVNHELVLRHLPDVETALALPLNQTFAHFTSEITNEVLYGLEHCADLLVRRAPEPMVPPDKLDELQGRLEDLRELIDDDELPPALRAFLALHVEAMLAALRKLPIVGITPLERELLAVVGSLATGGRQLDADATASGAKGDRVMRWVKNVVTVLSMISAAAGAPGDVQQIHAGVDRLVHELTAGD